MLRVRVGGAINLVPACRQTVSRGFWEAFKPQGVIVPVPIGVGLPRGSVSQSFYLSERGGVAGLEPALGLIPVAKQAWLVGSNSHRLNQSSALTIFGHPFTLYEAGRHLSRIEGLVLRHPPYPSKIRTLQSP
jgi:hypothetical protein